MIGLASRLRDASRSFQSVSAKLIPGLCRDRAPEAAARSEVTDLRKELLSNILPYEEHDCLLCFQKKCRHCQTINDFQNYILTSMVAE